MEAHGSLVQRNPSSISLEQEKNKAEYSINGISVKDLLATKSTLSKEEVKWMIDALENCKIHCMGVAKLYVGGACQGFCGASIVSEINLVGVYSHYIRIIDLNAFNFTKAMMVEQQLYHGFQYDLQANDKAQFPCKSRQIRLHFKDVDECLKFNRKVRGCMQHIADQTTAGNAVAHIKVQDAGDVDPMLAATIQDAESRRPAKVDNNGGFLADGLADIIALARQESMNAEAERNKRTANKGGYSPRAAAVSEPPPRALPNNNNNNYNNRGANRGNNMRGGPPARGGAPARGGPNGRVLTTQSSAPSVGAGRGAPARGAPNLSSQSSGSFVRHYQAAPVPEQRLTRASTLNSVAPTPPNRPTRAPTATTYTAPQIMPRESKVMKWQAQIQRPTGPVVGDLLVKIQCTKIGGVKTMKFAADTVTHEAIQRVAKQFGVSASEYGLFRRSGLPLDEDMTFGEQEVITNDILEFKLK